MVRQAGLFDAEERLRWLSEAGDPLEKLARTVDFELFRPELEAALARSDRSRGGRPPYDAVLMFTALRALPDGSPACPAGVVHALG